LLQHHPTTPIVFQSNFHRGCEYNLHHSVSLADDIKLFGVTFDSRLTFDKLISNVYSSSYFHIHALRRSRPFLDLETSKTISCAYVGSRLCKFHSYRHFFSQYPSSSLCSKFIGTSRYSLNYQYQLGLKFTSLASNSALNQFKLATPVHRSLHNAGAQYLTSVLHP